MMRDASSLKSPTGTKACCRQEHFPDRLLYLAKLALYDDNDGEE